MIDRKVKNKKTNYLIKWLEYLRLNNEWIKKKDMNNVKKVIEKYLNKFSTKNDKCVNKRRRWNENFLMHFFQIFFHEIFYHWFQRDIEKTKKTNKFQFIYKIIYFLTKRQKDDFLSMMTKNLNLKLFINNDLHDLNINVIVFLVIIIIIVDFSFFSFFFFFHLFLLFFSSFFSSFSFQRALSQKRSSTKHDFERRREIFFSQKDENRLWWRHDDV